MTGLPRLREVSELFSPSTETNHKPAKRPLLSFRRSYAAERESSKRNGMTPFKKLIDVDSNETATPSSDCNQHVVADHNLYFQTVAPLTKLPPQS